VAEANYDFTALNNSIDNISAISTNIEGLSSVLSAFFSNIDKRITEHFDEEFSNGLSSKQNDLDTDLTNCNSAGNWLSNTYSELIGTNAEVNSIASSAQSYEGDSTLTTQALGTAGAGTITAATLKKDKLSTVTKLTDSIKKANLYTIDAKEWASLPAKVKSAIEAKLKSLGFTDAEIKAIKNGEVTVDNARLESLSSSLEKALKANPDLRAELIELYGFDIFNEDGSINKTKLAIAMIIDDKNSKDQYNLESLILEEQPTRLQTKTVEKLEQVTPLEPSRTTSDQKQETIITENNNSTNAENKVTATASISQKINSNKSSTLHNGASYSKEANIESSLDEKTEALLDEMTTEDNIIKGVATSVASAKGQIPKGTINVKKSSVGVLPIAAGLTSSAAVAGGLTMATRQNKEEEEKFDEELLDEEILEGKNLPKEEQSENQETEKKEQEEDKEWLYGLGIRRPDQH